MICKKCNEEISNDHSRGLCFACFKETTAIELAAPDLLAALKELTRCVKTAGPHGTTWYAISDERMDNAKAAIGKAEGE